MEATITEKLFTDFMTKAAIQTVREQCPDDTFNQETVKKIQEEAESTVKELTLTLYKIKNEEKKGEDAVSHLPKDRIIKMKESLDLKTFEIKINEDEKTATIKRNGKIMYPSIALDSVSNLNQASNLQTASIIVESIILVLELVGVNIPNDEETVKRVIDLVINQLHHANNLITTVEQLRNDRGDYLAMAKHIFTLVVNTFYDGIFWTIVKSLLNEMSWIDWVVTAGKISAFIATLVGSGGLAQIAQLVMELVDAAYFLQKLVNLGTLQKMKLAITES